MTAGSNIETMDTLVKYTMSREAAEQVKKRFVDMAASGEAISYMDCVMFDAALDVLGEEQAYYGIGDDEWDEMLKARREAEKRYKTVRTIDVTDTWREVLS